MGKSISPTVSTIANAMAKETILETFMVRVIENPPLEKFDFNLESQNNDFIEKTIQKGVL